jgi:hypothetical protein
VTICPNDEDPGNYGVWDKVGRGVGNLKALRLLRITLNNESDEPAPDWEILAHILRHVSHAITLDFYSGNIQGTEEMRAFARAIQGHPEIRRFVTHGSFRFESTDILCSAWQRFQIWKMLSCIIGHLAERKYQTWNAPRA